MDLRLITPDLYPPQLKEIPFMPPDLWMRGSLPPLDTKFLTVIGSRSLSAYGRSVCQYLLKGLSGYPISIVSGLALGADACAHEAALDAGLHTIAIPGSGLFDSVIGPRTNFPLAMRILDEGGCLLSEQEPDHHPYPKDFPSRNRIMVGLSDAVLMIESASLSGTLISARMAGEFGRHLLCVPHPIDAEHAYGPHEYIRQGATLVSEPEHILEALKLTEEHLPTPLMLDHI